MEVLMQSPIAKMEVSAKLWRDSVGNTYHTATAILTYRDGRRYQWVSMVTYGYGNAWQETVAKDVLRVHKPLHVACATSGVEMVDNGAHYVRRRKDLDNGPRDAAMCWPIS